MSSAHLRLYLSGAWSRMISSFPPLAQLAAQWENTRAVPQPKEAPLEQQAQSELQHASVVQSICNMSEGRRRQVPLRLVKLRRIRHVVRLHANKRRPFMSASKDPLLGNRGIPVGDA